MAKKLRIAAMADIHVGRPDWGPYDELFREISETADVLLLCGDLTTMGTADEARQLATQLQSAHIPVLGVLGNHDITSGQEKEVKQILREAKMIILDAEPYSIDDVGFAGTKGFGGGFGQHMLGSFGESTIKSFVDEAVSETLILERQLSELDTKKKVVLMHYSPIRDTVIGEPEEIFPFLGSSRLAEPLDNFEVNAVFHGHAHVGSPLGKTIKGIPVYNVAYPLMQKTSPKRPYAFVEF